MYVGPKIVEDGLVLALDAGSKISYPGSGTTWYDLSGNGNNGTLTNGPTFSNGSIVFDGVNDYVVKTSTTIDLSDGVSVEVVFKINDLLTTNRAVMSYNVGSSYIDIITIPDGRLRWETWVSNTSGIGGAIYTPTGGLSNDTWYHGIGTYTNGISVFYINANNVVSTTYGTPGSYNSTYTADIRIGRHISTYGSGELPIIKIYNRALTSQEVLQNYNATKNRFGL